MGLKEIFGVGLEKVMGRIGGPRITDSNDIFSDMGDSSLLGRSDIAEEIAAASLAAKEAVKDVVKPSVRYGKLTNS